VATFSAGFAAARPIGRAFGKWLVPHVLSYESSKLALCTAFLDISEHLDTKLAALREYASQHRPVPHVRCEESVAALATVRGAEIGVRYVEAFEVHRTLL
jgi:hypothetical protein